MTAEIEESKAGILFVDDSRNVRESLQRILWDMEATWRMRFVSSGQEALDVLARDAIDLVVADLQMPEMDGLELLRQVGALHPDVRACLLAGDPSPEAIAESRKRGYGLIEKPCDSERLKDEIRKALNGMPVSRKNSP